MNTLFCLHLETVVLIILQRIRIKVVYAYILIFVLKL